MPGNVSVSGERDSARTQLGYVKFFGKLESVGPYLEIGADMGLLTGALLAKAEFTQVNLVEPNQASHPELLKNSPRKSKVFLDIHEIPATYLHSHVGAVHVLDHLVNPKKDLTEIVSRMHSGATLVAIIHNEKSLLRKVLRTKWPPFCLQHPQLFNRKTITTLLETVGLNVVDIKRTQNYVGVSHMVNLLKQIGLVSKKFRPRDQNLSIALFLGNIAVIAKKP
jgi:hypothetical protein